MTTSTLTKTAAALALAMSALSVQAATVANGSFEAPEVGSGTWQIINNPNMPGWTTGNAGVEIRNNAVGTAQEGSQFVELDTTTNSWISQVIKATEGQEYTLSFWYSPRIARTSAEDNRIEVWWNDKLVEAVEGIGGTAHVWKEYLVVLSGVTVAASNTLKFAAAGTPNSFGGSLDNVSLTATPLPGAALLFGTSIAGFLAARKRRKAAALAA